MTGPIDPVRRPQPARRSAADRGGHADEGRAEVANLPALVEGEEPQGPPPSPTREAPAAFAAHLLGQDGQKRGLRGGPPLIDAARQAYVSTEWSGPADRRGPRGRTAKKEI